MRGRSYLGSRNAPDRWQPDVLCGADPAARCEAIVLAGAKVDGFAAFGSKRKGAALEDALSCSKSNKRDVTGQRVKVHSEEKRTLYRNYRVSLTQPLARIPPSTDGFPSKSQSLSQKSRRRGAK